ncbi:DAF1 protein, partial [Urocynchramus pylzowi]|nr:DAF1 protein [Urocynchramus pylzowi]
PALFSVLLCPLSSVLQCPSPPTIDKGNHDSQGLEAFPTGMVVNYSCDPGYSLRGEASIYCTSSGNWSLPLPQCAAVTCLQPPNITNGKLKGNTSATFPSGAAVSYSCDPGYSLVGNASINCTVSGSWSQPLPQCKGES